MFDIAKIKGLLDIKSRFLKEQISFGLDVGTTSIRLIKLKKSREKIELCDMRMEPSLPDLSRSLKLVAQACDNKSVNISVSGSGVVMRYAAFPRMKPEELKQSLRFEAQKHIPFSVAEVNLDACMLKEDLPDNKMLVLLAAVKKDFLSQRLKIIEDAGFKIALVDVDFVALSNAFNFNFPSEDNQTHKAIAILNIGTTVSNLNVLEGGIPRLSRDIHVAGANITRKISDMLGIDLEKAEELKKSSDKEFLSKVSKVIEPVVSDMANELRISFDYYESQSASSVSKIFLSGGGGFIEGFPAVLSGSLGIETAFWNPLEKIQIAQNLDAEKIKAAGFQLAVAFGLALRS